MRMGRMMAWAPLGALLTIGATGCGSKEPAPTPTAEATEAPKAAPMPVPTTTRSVPVVMVSEHGGGAARVSTSATPVAVATPTPNLELPARIPSAGEQPAPMTTVDPSALILPDDESESAPVGLPVTVTGQSCCGQNDLQMTKEPRLAIRATDGQIYLLEGSGATFQDCFEHRSQGLTLTAHGIAFPQSGHYSLRVQDVHRSN